MPNPKLIVHGGAWDIPDELDAAHLAGIERAVHETFPKLREGLSALDAVENAVRIMEADPTFDAGHGAFLNEIGQIELDAMIMDGRKLDYGAVGALPNFLHPVSIARRIMEASEHCLLVSHGARRFALQQNFREVPTETLLTQRELVFYDQIKKDDNFRTHHPFDRRPGDTVGAVALDREGNVAAATSTGGTPRKLVGRVGDSPIAGSGAYADNASGGVSATGWGESIMKMVLSKTCCDLLGRYPAHEAATETIRQLTERIDGKAGLIGIDKNGNYAFAHNTPKMAFAFAQPNGKIMRSMHHKAPPK